MSLYHDALAVRCWRHDAPSGTPCFPETNMVCTDRLKEAES